MEKIKYIIISLKLDLFFSTRNLGIIILLSIFVINFSENDWIKILAIWACTLSGSFFIYNLMSEIGILKYIENKIDKWNE